MARIWKGPAAGQDARNDLLDEVGDICLFIQQLGSRWALIRNLIPDDSSGYPLYELLPEEFVSMLDDAGDVLVCEHEDCLKPVHGDWDFCESHGEESEDDSEV